MAGQRKGEKDWYRIAGHRGSLGRSQARGLNTSTRRVRRERRRPVSEMETLKRESGSFNIKERQENIPRGKPVLQSISCDPGNMWCPSEGSTGEASRVLLS